MAIETAVPMTDFYWNIWRVECGEDYQGHKDRFLNKQAWDGIQCWEKAAANGAYGSLGPRFPYLVFVGDKMDFAENRRDLDAIRDQMWLTIRYSQHLIFQLVTREVRSIEKCLPADWGKGYPNVWLGVWVEDQRTAWKADVLQQIPAAVRFVCHEPAIGPLDNLNLSGIDWVITGESGSQPECKDWARVMRDKCEEAGVPFFYKQSARSIDGESGVELDGRLHQEFPVGRYRRT